MFKAKCSKNHEQIETHEYGCYAVTGVLMITTKELISCKSSRSK